MASPCEWVRLDPAPTRCIAYASGECCHDKHFDPREVMPDMQAVACGQDAPTWTATTDKNKVNCKECMEMIHS